MKTKSKKPSKARIKKKCDDLFSLIIRVKGYCEWCGRSDIQLNAHHSIGRGVEILRYDPRNMCCLCVNCHEFATLHSVKNDGQSYWEWFKSVRPEDYDYIKSEKYKTIQRRIADYQELYQELKEAINEIQEP